METKERLFHQFTSNFPNRNSSSSRLRFLLRERKGFVKNVKKTETVSEITRSRGISHKFS